MGGRVRAHFRTIDSGARLLAAESSESVAGSDSIMATRVRFNPANAAALEWERGHKGIYMAHSPTQGNRGGKQRCCWARPLRTRGKE